MSYSKIPDRYQVGGTEIEVRNVERCENNSIGRTYLCSGFVEIADVYDKDKKQSDSSKVNTFYHELTHTILGTMGEFELNDNEKFVNTFASFLTEAMKDAYFLDREVQTTYINEKGEILNIPDKYKDR